MSGSSHKEYPVLFMALSIKKPGIAAGLFPLIGEAISRHGS
jgi:hypothetical protein